MNDGWLLARALSAPETALALDGAGWTDLLAIARAEQLIGTLAHRVDGLPVPNAVRRILDDARASAEQGRIVALWEAEMARRLLAPLGVAVVLLKGTAFVAAGLAAGQGRSIGDLDILVPRDRIDMVEAALLAGGWEWVKPDPYDDDYYRRWMHELPPLIHRERDRMIDVHHTILPLTARITPDARALLVGSIELAPGMRTLSPNDMLVHAAAHLFADGDLAGGMRNLWDVHCLVGEFGTDQLVKRATHHGLKREVGRALRLAVALYGDDAKLTLTDRLYLRRLTARDGWGWPIRPFTRLGFYVRSHWLRMPPMMLARHLWIKWRHGHILP
ncbi:hypothetical protein ACVWZA_003406 [Sphingomonas sp. UYAg733]